MPCDKKISCATCYNLRPSLTIIIDDEDQYFKKKSKTLHNAMCQTLMDGWKLITSIWHYDCSCNGVAYNWKWVVSTKL
jgi:hypothetical protein